jgi:replicative DNA helicase
MSSNKDTDFTFLGSRVPPCDLEAEKIVLSAMMQEPDSADIAFDELKPADFYHDAHRRLFEVMLGFKRQDKVFDWFTVKNEAIAQGLLDALGGDVGFLGLIDAAPNAAMVGEYSAIVRERAMQRIAAAIGIQTIKSAYDNSVPIEESMKGIEGKISEIHGRIDDHKPRTCRTIKEWISDPETMKPPQRISSGYAVLDAALHGGFVRGAMSLLCGRTSRGKSTFANNIALNAAKAGMKTVLITLEDSISLAIYRMIASNAGIAVSLPEAYFGGTASSDNAITVEKSKFEIENLPLEIESTARDVSQLLALVKDKFDRDLIVIDQSSHLSMPDIQSEYEMVSRVCSTLKDAARLANVAILVLVQINRKGAEDARQESRYTLENIKGTGKWEEDCRQCLIIQPPDPSLPGDFTVSVAKNTYGSRDIDVKLSWQYECSKISERKTDIGEADSALIEMQIDRKPKIAIDRQLRKREEQMILRRGEKRTMQDSEILKLIPVFPESIKRQQLIAQALNNPSFTGKIVRDTIERLEGLSKITSIKGTKNNEKSFSKPL